MQIAVFTALVQVMTGPISPDLSSSGSSAIGSSGSEMAHWVNPQIIHSFIASFIWTIKWNKTKIILCWWLSSATQHKKNPIKYWKVRFWRCCASNLEIQTWSGGGGSTFLILYWFCLSVQVLFKQETIPLGPSS